MTNEQIKLYTLYHSSKDVKNRYAIAKDIVLLNKQTPITYYWQNESLEVLPNELWKPLNVSYFNSYFQMSNFCRLRRLFRHVAYRNGNPKRWEERIISPTGKLPNRLKYTAYVDNNTLRILANRSVALTFIDNKENKPCVNHIDGDPLNNYYLNLEWATYSENELHSFNVLGKQLPKPKGMNSPSWRGKVSQISLTGEKIKTFDCIKDVEKDGFYTSHVYRVVNGERKTTGGYVWQLET